MSTQWSWLDTLIITSTNATWHLDGPLFVSLEPLRLQYFIFAPEDPFPCNPSIFRIRIIAGGIVLSCYITLGLVNSHASKLWAPRQEMPLNRAFVHQSTQVKFVIHATITKDHSNDGHWLKKRDDNKTTRLKGSRSRLSAFLGAFKFFLALSCSVHQCLLHSSVPW